ncbi:YqgQ family protein [Streptococcus merionis]|uniref:YqgQ family protein n=1 Tax=Streptococcus merionis TaxID=400065 RepID=UPI0026ED6320|nr:YqgQ family protein [Streptococcus merionis]
MRTYYDVQQLLRQFGILIYMGNRLYDIEMSRIELKQVHESGLISTQEYLQAELVLRQEHGRELEYQEKKRKRNG